MGSSISHVEKSEVDQMIEYQRMLLGFVDQYFDEKAPHKRREAMINLMDRRRDFKSNGDITYINSCVSTLIEDTNLSRDCLLPPRIIVAYKNRAGLYCYISVDLRSCTTEKVDACSGKMPTVWIMRTRGLCPSPLLPLNRNEKTFVDQNGRPVRLPGRELMAAINNKYLFARSWNGTWDGIFDIIQIDSNGEEKILRTISFPKMSGQGLFYALNLFDGRVFFMIFYAMRISFGPGRAIHMSKGLHTFIIDFETNSERYIGRSISNNIEQLIKEEIYSMNIFLLPHGKEEIRVAADFITKQQPIICSDVSLIIGNYLG
ncbi:MAG: hypothetical protein Harvfovirus1_71 [Harvfovirus sp.]|uniref:Uncharacterized protein n=1 Tax=Harvfovirus sp. TaxID=2487768 RepID=A0A3G4ZZQ0_9VIRU|nr:MAG: hypothetical protein Harvfovirus1_71 [Harvfovirus sp.]